MTGVASLRTEFAAALADYLAGGGEAALVRSEELGRAACREGAGVLELAAIQHEAELAALSQLAAPAPVVQRIAAGQRCLQAALAPFDALHRALREANAALRHFNDSLEAEIRQAAHILDAQTGQLLAAVQLEISDLQRSRPEELPDRVRQVKALLRLVEGQLRHLTHEIRPTVLDDLGLVPALEFLRDGVEHRSGLRIHVAGPATERFPQWLEITVYRIVQEALANVVRHARATAVAVSVGVRDGRLVCAVRDDGVGFDAAALGARGRTRGFGLPGIRERLQRAGGNLEIHSAPGCGTELVVSIPIRAPDWELPRTGDEGGKTARDA